MIGRDKQKIGVLSCALLLSFIFFDTIKALSQPSSLQIHDNTNDSLQQLRLLPTDDDIEGASLSPLQQQHHHPQEQHQRHHHYHHYYIALYKPALTLCNFSNDRECAQRKHRTVRSTLSSLNLPFLSAAAAAAAAAVDTVPPPEEQASITATSTTSTISCNWHTCGRLDRDSEGLLLLTTDGAFTSRICEPEPSLFKKKDHDNDDETVMTRMPKISKRYLARVEGVPNHSALEQMRQGGLMIRGALTRPPVSVKLLLLDEKRDSQHEQDDHDHDHEQDDHEHTATTTTTLLSSLPPAVHSMKDRQGSYSWVEIILAEGRNRQVRRITANAGHPTIRLVRTSIGTLELGDCDLFEPGRWCYITKEQVLGVRDR